MCAAAQLFGRQFGEPALDEVQPRARGRGEVQREARVREQPALDRRRLVRGAVVEHEVNVELGGNFGVDALQELLKLDRAMAAVQRSDDLAGAQVKGRVEARGA